MRIFWPCPLFYGGFKCIHYAYIVLVVRWCLLGVLFCCSRREALRLSDAGRKAICCRFSCIMLFAASISSKGSWCFFCCWTDPTCFSRSDDEIGIFIVWVRGSCCGVAAMLLGKDKFVVTSLLKFSETDESLVPCLGDTYCMLFVNIVPRLYNFQGWIKAKQAYV